MPRKKKVPEKPILNCLCDVCAQARLKYGENVIYCLRCATICPKLKDYCHDCQYCNHCKRDSHYTCQNQGCGKSICSLSKDFCNRCIKCGMCCKCTKCRFCGLKKSLADGRDGCLACMRCYTCGRCKCARKENFIKLARSKAEYNKRTSVADLILRDGTVVNKARVAFHKSAINEFKLNSLKRYVSVEMEIAGLSPGPLENSYDTPLKFSLKTLPINTVVEGWRANLVEDMSLPAYGFEINTAPANGDKFIRQIEDITGVLDQFGATVRNNYDGRKRQMCCGLHVHADARDFFYADMQRFLLLYEHIEDAIYQMLPGYRRASHFAQKCGKKYGVMVRACKPIPPQEKKKSPDPVKQGLIMATYDKGLPDRSGKRECPQETRYRSVNLHQYFYRGTIEFRHMYGTVDKHEIMNWAVLVGAILDYAQKQSHKTITKDIESLSGQALLLVIANQIRSTDVINLPQFIMQQTIKYEHDHNEKESPVLGEIAMVPELRPQPRENIPMPAPDNAPVDMRFAEIAAAAEQVAARRRRVR